MEQKLNIAKILRNKPRGTKLYSMIHGKCSFEAVTDEIFKINFCTSKFGLTQSGECTLIKFGNMYDGGECIIFPSKEMRDWSKFSWKKGDVLISNDGGTEVIFDNGTMILIQVSIVNITLTVKIRIRSYITKNSYAQLQDILLKIRILFRLTSKLSRKNWVVNSIVRHWG